MGKIYTLPSLAKSIFALTIPVIGFSSDQLLKFFQDQQLPYKEKVDGLVKASWQYFLVILMASTTASVIGVNEIMASANTLIATSGDPRLTLPVYAYVALWFITSSLLFSYIFHRACGFFIINHKKNI
ncbi:hypothetical protein H0A36_03860 [Endozoicomonas sp. SM1973]|uniref:Uncharacterized protein n=1 Tax=Spartinivicinus marinus TaxID=2994442 RepID=A0A853I5B4_9GAMM|nr:hypothetical protein [Spartinivicinus marinus]MCX4029556.1 hypothetical protein [Spartinivicinus marinus]NYZ65131.1 hypothetical protein [Spartinivicinus marinus]